MGAGWDLSFLEFWGIAFGFVLWWWLRIDPACVGWGVAGCVWTDVAHSDSGVASADYDVTPPNIFLKDSSQSTG
jgi:hypothetical protein